MAAASRGGGSPASWALDFWLLSLHGGHLCAETRSMLRGNCLGALRGGVLCWDIYTLEPV